MQSKPRKSGVVTGALLILLGILFLIAQFVKFEGWIFLTGLGIVFLAAGWLLKNYGLLIPGGILTGLGIGIGVGESGYIPEGPGQAGAIVLGIGSRKGLDRQGPSYWELDSGSSSYGPLVGL